MRKIFLGVLIAVTALSLSGAVLAGAGSPGEKAPWPYAVNSESPVFKSLFEVRHEFPGKFTATLTPRQVKLLGLLGVEVEPVQLYYIAGKPGTVCGNGACEPSENKNNCPEDCNGGGDDEEPPAERSCYPEDQTPWGIEKVYGDPSLTETSGGAGVDVAVLDTGLYKEHLDLVNRVEQCVDFTGGGPPGAVRVRRGKCEDKNGHGTHVAATILADGGADGMGVYGVAPEADLLAYKVCAEQGCYTDDIAAAIDYAGENGAEIVSMSLGGDTQSSLIKEAIDRNGGILFVAAAGNDGPGTGSIDYPGAYVKVVAAGAIDVNKAVPDWSSRGVNDGDYVIEEREVEFGTPGVLVESANNDGCYTYKSGTSMATPHVSGLAAKLWQGKAADTRSYLQGKADDIWEEGDDPATGLGLPGAN